MIVARLRLAALLQRKNGRLGREDHTWPGDETDGGGRRPRYAAGQPAGLGVPAPQWPRMNTPEPRTRHPG